MQTFDLLALAQERRVVREREAQLERMRHATVEPTPPRAPAVANVPGMPSRADAAPCEHASAA